MWHTNGHAHKELHSRMVCIRLVPAGVFINGKIVNYLNYLYLVMDKKKKKVK